MSDERCTKERPCPVCQAFLDKMGSRLPKPVNPDVVDWELRKRVEAEIEWSESGGFYDIRTGQRTRSDPLAWVEDDDEG